MHQQPTTVTEAQLLPSLIKEFCCKLLKQKQGIEIDGWIRPMGDAELRQEMNRKPMLSNDRQEPYEGPKDLYVPSVIAHHEEAGPCPPSGSNCNKGRPSGAED
ncbi:hypothetical protein Tco_1338692 [Tanacetum coccineum]